VPQCLIDVVSAAIAHCCASPRAAMQYDVAPPSAASPKAPGVFSNARSYLSFSSAETVTPESGAGGWPSRASGDGSAMDGSVGFASGGSFLSRGISPDSHPSLVDLERVNTSGKHYLAADHSDEVSTRAGTASTSARPTRGARAGELRRRKYAAPQGHRFNDDNATGIHIGALAATPSHRMHQPALTPSSGDALGVAGEPSWRSTARASSSSAGVVSGHEPKDCEVLLEGPLQQRALLFFWRWRWCVLSHEELRIYVDEEASLLMPERPVERHPARKLSAAPDLHFPTVLVCANMDGTGEPLMYLRTGPGVRWEELAAASLWLRAFASLPPASGRSTTNAARTAEGPCANTAAAGLVATSGDTATAAIVGGTNGNGGGRGGECGRATLAAAPAAAAVVALALEADANPFAASDATEAVADTSTQTVASAPVPGTGEAAALAAAPGELAVRRHW